jgi:uncharacterized membrane protein
MNVKVASSYLLGIIFLLSGVGHFVMAPDFVRFLPNSMPAKELAVAATGVLHLAVGAGMLVPRTRSLASLVALILLVVYLPLHVVDLNRYMPVIGSKAMAWLRIPGQLLLILMAYLATRWEKS